MKSEEISSAPDVTISHLLRDRDFYKSKLFDSWKALAQQQKGMRRMARRIKKLRQRELQLKAARSLLADAKDWVPRDTAPSLWADIDLFLFEDPSAKRSGGDVK